MNNLNVRKGDNVKVLTGKDKGKTGKVLAADPKSGRVLVEGVNIAAHHRKARGAGQQSTIAKVEAPIDSSNVQIICPSCGKNVRVRHQVVDGKNARICAKCGASLDAALKADKKKKDKSDKKSSKKAAKADKVEDAAAETPVENAGVSAEEVPAKKAAKKPADKTEKTEKAAKTAKKKAEVPVEEGKTE